MSYPAFVLLIALRLVLLPASRLSRLRLRLRDACH